jgi:hypothetical protein
MGMTPYSLEVVSENKQNLGPRIDIHIFASGTLDIWIYMHMVTSDTVRTRNSAKLAEISNWQGKLRNEPWKPSDLRIIAR